ncbi:MAG: SPFH domain-containing protein [Candidatus Micrarchaeota archaeon]
MVFVVINEYERGLRFTLGKFSGILGPGVALNLPFLHHTIVVDIRTKTVKIPQQETMSRDNVPLNINAVVYYHIVDAKKAVLSIADIDYAVLQYAQTAMRDIIGKNEMDHILSDRERIATQVEEIVDKEVAGWGVDITAIKIQDIEMPEDMKRTMARQAEGERIRRSTVILAQGELAAAKNYASAAETLAKSPGALYLKTLQTLSTTISQEDAPTSIILVPSNLMKVVENLVGKK